MKKTLFLLIFCSARLFAYDLPNPSLTPGDTNPALTKEVLCSKTFRTGPYRNVPLSEHKAGFKAYGIDYANHRQYELDHLVSLEIGGSNDLKNLWPQPWGEARIKDKLENELHRRVCKGQMSLEEAQQSIAKDWVSEYQVLFDDKGAVK